MDTFEETLRNTHRKIQTQSHSSMFCPTLEFAVRATTIYVVPSTSPGSGPTPFGG